MEGVKPPEGELVVVTESWEVRADRALETERE